MSILSRTKSLINAYVDYAAKARTVAELSQLSDHQLKDIGLDRTQLHTQLKAVWVNNAEAPGIKAVPVATVITVKQPTRRHDSGLAQQLVSMYSAWNRPGYVV